MRAFGYVLLVAALLATVLRLVEILRPRHIPIVPRLVLVYLITGLPLPFAAAWLLYSPLSQLAASGGWVQGLLALAGLALGGLGLGQLCLASALVFGVIRADASLSLGFVTPALAAIFLRFAVGGRWRERRHRSAMQRIPTGHLEQLRTSVRYGEMVKLPGVHDRVVRIVHVAFGSVPVLLAVALFPWTDDPKLAVLRLVGAAVITANFWVLDYGLGRLLRDSRLAARAVDTGLFLLAVGITASPLGGWMAAALPRNGAAYALLLSLIIGLPFSARLLIMRGADGARRGFFRVAFFVGWPYRLMVDKGLFLFFTVGVFHADVRLLWGAVALALYELGRTANEVFRQQMSTLRAVEVSQLEKMFDVADEHRMEVWGIWLYDAFWERPAKPDATLILRLMVQAAALAHGQGNPLFVGRLLGDARLSEPGRPRRWLELADEGLALAERELPPRWPAGHRDALDRALGQVRAQGALIHALVYQYENLREEALEAYRAAVAGFEALGLRETAAWARVAAANCLAGMLGRPADARRELEPVLTDSGVTGLTRRYALNAASFAEAMRGDIAAAAELRAGAQRIPVARKDVRRLAHEGMPGIPRGGSLHLFRRMLQQQEDWAGMLLGETPFDPGALPPALEFPPRARTVQGIALLHAGDVAAARAVLAEAVQLADAQGWLTWVATAHYHLAQSHLPDDAPKALSHLRHALAAMADIRARVLGPDQRIDVGGQYEDVYELAVRLLLAGRALQGPGWPERPVAEAFELVEQARSRVFLESLGETAQPAPPAGVDVLLAEEASLRAAVQEQQESLDAVTAEHRPAALSRLRETRRALEEIWSRLEAASPPAAEYVQLRRGAPVRFAEIRELLALEHVREPAVAASSRE